jgi:hypothetical protein
MERIATILGLDKCDEDGRQLTEEELEVSLVLVALVGQGPMWVRGEMPFSETCSSALRLPRNRSAWLPRPWT